MAEVTWNRASTLLSLAAVTVLLAAGCIQPASQSPGAAAPAKSVEPTVVNIAAVSNINYTAYYVGIEKGIFLKHGIDLKLQTFPGPSDIVKALQAGQAQIGTGAWSGIVPPRFQGINFKAIFFGVSDPNVEIYDQFVAIVVRPGLDNVKRVEDMAGLTIGSSFGGGTDTYLRTRLQMAGVADKVELKNVPAVDLQAGFGHGVDAGSTGEPYVSKILVEMPGSHVIVRGGCIANTRVLIFTTDEWLNVNPALAEQFWAASAEATQYLRQHPDDAAAAASRVLGGIDANIIRKAFENFTFDPRHSAKIDNGFLAESKLLVEQKRIPSVPNISDVIAVNLMESAQAKYKEYLSDLPPIQP